MALNSSSNGRKTNPIKSNFEMWEVYSATQDNVKERVLITPDENSIRFARIAARFEKAMAIKDARGKEKLSSEIERVAVESLAAGRSEAIAAKELDSAALS